MNMNQFTQKSLEAIQNAQNLAAQYGNQQIEQPHLLLALLDQEGGFIPQLLTHMGLTLESFRAAARHEVELLPKVSGSGREADKMCIRDRARPVPAECLPNGPGRAGRPPFSGLPPRFHIG